MSFCQVETTLYRVKRLYDCLSYLLINEPTVSSFLSLALVPQNPSIEYAAIAVFFGILIFLLLLTIIAAIMLFILRDHVLIRRNTPSISFAVLFGTVLVCASGIILCTGVNSATCYLKAFLYNIGMGIMLGGIIAKEYRIYRIFSNKSATAVEISDNRLFLIIFVITFYFFVLACLTIIGDLQARIIVSESNEFYLFVRCTLKTETWTVFVAILNNVSFFIFRVFSVVLAWLTRRVDSIYSEARQVEAVVIIYLCAVLIFTPLIESLKNGTDSAIYKSCIEFVALSIIIAATLIFLFYSRFWMVYRYEKRKKERLDRY